MRCLYCEKNVIGKRDIRIVPGHGPSHVDCHNIHLETTRVFEGICLKSIDASKLVALKEMVITELNARFTPQDEAIELF